MLIPFRTKNPPENFPYVTISLIVLNILIYFVTSIGSYCLRIDDTVLEQFAVTHNTLSLWRLTTAMFLHGDIMHILSNMLALWIFGAATEGRLRPARFLLVYFLAGWTGGLLSDLLLGAVSPDTPSLGASGAIMGIMGAYLYMFPFSRIRSFYLWGFSFLIRFGVVDLQAFWIVLMYVGLDILFGLVIHSADGVGHYAHLGGFATGLFTVFLMRVRRDSEQVSEAQAVLDESKRDYTVLGYAELEAMLQQPTENMDLVLAFCEKAVSYGDPIRQQKCMAYLNYYAPKLLGQADPNRLAAVVLSLPPASGGLPLVYYLRLGSRLEAIVSNSMALQVYRKIYDLAPTAPDTEMALYRSAHIMLTAFNDRQHAFAAYQEILRLFPNGQMSLQVRRALGQMR